MNLFRRDLEINTGREILLIDLIRLIGKDNSSKMAEMTCLICIECFPRKRKIDRRIGRRRSKRTIGIRRSISWRSDHCGRFIERNEQGIKLFQRLVKRELITLSRSSVSRVDWNLPRSAC